MRWCSFVLAITMLAISCSSALGVEEMAGSYRLPLSLAASPQNAANALLAARMLNGVEVKSGQVFSFNRAIGPRSAKRGFIIGLVSAKEKYLTDYGGGVCMTASVLHQAVKAADLKVLERHNHVIQSRYLPLGEDAAVSFGVEDFRFKNTSPYPLKIYAGESEQALNISLWQIKPDPALIIVVNGVELKPAPNIKIENGVPMVPVRAVAESLGGKISWNSTMGRAVIINGQDILELQANSIRAFINQKPLSLETAPRIKEGVLSLPLQVLADSMGFKSYWDQSQKMVVINTIPKVQAPALPDQGEPDLIR